MAYTVRVKAFEFPAISPMLRLEPSWWDTNELMKDERFKLEQDIPGYSDYVARLTPAEFKELNDHFRPRAFSPNGVRSRADVTLLDAVAEYLAADHHHFVVTVFEWDSGF